MSKPATTFNAAKARAKRPCPIWVDAFHRETQLLGPDEIGGYFLMIMAMWSREGCDLPDDDMRLAKVCRVSKRLWLSRVGPALRPFFQTVDGVLVSKRLRIEASYVEKFCLKQHLRKAGSSQESDPYGFPEGSSERYEENSENPANHLTNNDTASTADASTDEPRIHPTQQPNNPTVRDGGGGSAGGKSHGQDASPNLTDRELILEAMGVDRSGMTGKGGTRIGTQADMAEVDRWLELPGMTMPIILAEIERMVATKTDGPPSSFKYFTKAMCRLSGDLTRPALTPDITQPTAPRGGRNDRASFDRTINELADRLSDGSVQLDYRSRDPFASEPR